MYVRLRRTVTHYVRGGALQHLRSRNVVLHETHHTSLNTDTITSSWDFVQIQ